MKEKKRELRKRIAALKIQHADASTRLSAEVMEALEAYPPFRQAETVLLYYSLPDEVATHEFIDRWYTRKQLLLPAVVGDDLELRRYTGPQSMAIGAYGIAEPVGEAFTRLSDIDLVVVPGVAFDQQGHRLGRGKGYYDRLLPQLRAHKVGICYPYQLLEEVPAEPFDVLMDAVISGR